MIVIKINGREHEAREGERLIKVLREKDVKIPSLCFHPALIPSASCRLCVVEVKQPGKPPRSRLSCAARIKAGMEVVTESAMIYQMRNTAIADLLKMAPEAEAIHRIGCEFGLSTGMKPDGCIRCRLCVRVCTEIIGAKALVMEKRDGRGYVAPSKTGECIGCLTCVNICPTKALRFEDQGRVRTIMIRDEVIGKHTLERCEMCGRLFATTSFLAHVKDREKGHREKKAERLHCPSCAKLTYRRNLRMTAPQFTKS